MWRCNDELRVRAEELHSSSGSKVTKYYIGNHKQKHLCLLNFCLPYRLLQKSPLVFSN